MCRGSLLPFSAPCGHAQWHARAARARVRRQRDRRTSKECIRHRLGLVGRQVTSTASSAMLAEVTGARHAVAVVNGTAALHVCLHAGRREAGRRGARAGAHLRRHRQRGRLLRARARTSSTVEPGRSGWMPHALGDHLARDRAKRRRRHASTAQTGRRIAAHRPDARLRPPGRIWTRSSQWRVAGDMSRRRGRRRVARLHLATGTRGGFGPLAALSFNGNKIVTTGGGGAILTNDEELGRRAKHLTTTAKLPHRWAFVHDEVGYNYRLPNLNAALGLRPARAARPASSPASAGWPQRYQRASRAFRGVQFLARAGRARPATTGSTPSCSTRPHAAARDEVLTALNAAGFGTRPAWTLMHRLPMFAACPRGDLRVAESIERRLINLPSSASFRPAMTDTPRNICVVTGSRADYGLLIWLMRAIRETAGLELQLVVTGMHLSPEFGYTVDKIEADGFAIDATRRDAALQRLRRRRRQVHRARRDRLRRCVRAARARPRRGARRPLRDPRGGAGRDVHAAPDGTSTAATSPRAQSTNRSATRSPRCRTCISRPMPIRRGGCPSSARTRAHLHGRIARPRSISG